MRLVLLLLVAFTGVARAQTPMDRAKAIIETQRALLDKDKAGAKALLTAMDPDAIVVSRMAVERAGRILELMAGKTINGIDETLARNALDPVFWTNWDPDAMAAHKATVKSTVSNLVAGGRADAVWFTFELAVDRTTVEAKPFKMNHKFRITELVVDKAGWKVMLFYVDQAEPDEWDELPSLGGGPPGSVHFTSYDDSKQPATKLDELTTSPLKLAKALLIEPSTIVLGSSASDRGVGPAAAKVVGSWSKLKLESELSLERVTKTWAFSVVRLDLNGKNEDQKMRMFALVIALPKPDKTWQVVTLRYSRIAWI